MTERAILDVDDAFERIRSVGKGIAIGVFVDIVFDLVDFLGTSEPTLLLLFNWCSSSLGANG